MKKLYKKILKKIYKALPKSVTQFYRKVRKYLVLRIVYPLTYKFFAL